MGTVLLCRPWEELLKPYLVIVLDLMMYGVSVILFILSTYSGDCDLKPDGTGLRSRGESLLSTHVNSLFYSFIV